MPGSTDEPVPAGDGDESLIARVETPPVHTNTLDSDSETVSAKVPWIGEAWRWYDIPYRACHLLLTGWRRRLFGWRARQSINRWSNFFIAFNEVERHRAQPLDNRMRNLLVPSEEHVRQGGIWVIEIFPPSRYSQLVKALRENGWDRNDAFREHSGTNVQQVQDARSGRTWRWWRLGGVADPESGFIGLGENRERLPREFSLIDVRAMQVGSSLTMVSAFFRLSDIGRDRLDEVWHATHEPTLTLRGLRRPQVEDRHFAAIRSGQAERQRLHDLARDWLAKRCPGVFADSEGRHPVVDLMLFQILDPTAEAPGRDLSESLRALGLDRMTSALFLSPQLPGLVLVPSREKASNNYDVLSNCWAAVGQERRVSELAQTPGYGEPPYSPQTLAHVFDDEMRAFSQYIAVNRYLDDLGATYARARDAALSRHGRFSARRLLQLRRELLTTGLDLSTVGRDTADLWNPDWRSFAGVQITGAEPIGLPASVSRREDFDFIEQLAILRESKLEALRADDRAYREALVTAASLGASVEASRMGRRALWVAAVSLAVATATLLVADTSANTLWSELIGWLR